MAKTISSMMYITGTSLGSSTVRIVVSTSATLVELMAIEVSKLSLTDVWFEIRVTEVVVSESDELPGPTAMTNLSGWTS